MKIAINGQTLLTKEFRPTGPYVYTENLIKTLAKIDFENKYIIYLSDQYTRSGEFSELTLGNPNFEVKVVKKKTLWTQIDLLLALWQDKPDVFFTAIHTFPVLSWFWLKTVVMIHGLEYKYSPISRSWKKYFQAMPIWATAFCASKIIVPSQATRNATLTRLHFISESKITVVPEGVNPEFYKRQIKEATDARAKYGLLNSDYLFFISTIQPRKNIPNTIAGFSKALQTLNENGQNLNLKFALSGKKGWLFEESLEAPKKYGVEDKVTFLGPVPTYDLPALMTGALGYINLSFEEGFGLPVLEALACEKVCVVSDIPAYRELDGGNLIFVNPNDIDSITQGIVTMIKEANDGGSDFETRVKKGNDVIAKYSWNLTAINTLEVIKKAFSVF